MLKYSLLLKTYKGKNPMKIMPRKFFLLRLFLVTGAFGWGVSVLMIVAPWGIAAEALYGLGAAKIQYCPMLDYWLRMAAGAFTMIGILFAISAVKPEKYRVLIPILGYLNIFEGLILLTYGVKLGLRPFPFYSDTSFCILIGLGIVLLNYYSESSDK